MLLELAVLLLLLAVLTALNPLETPASLLLLHAADSLGYLLCLLTGLLAVMALALKRFLDFFADFFTVEAFSFKALNILLADAGALEFLPNLLFLAGLMLLELLASALLLLAIKLLLTPLFLAEAALGAFIHAPAFLLVHAADSLRNLLGLLTSLLAVNTPALQ
jgi:hypothetical protein